MRDMISLPPLHDLPPCLRFPAFGSPQAMKEWRRTHQDALHDIIGKVTQPFTEVKNTSSGYDAHGRRISQSRKPSPRPAR